MSIISLSSLLALLLGSDAEGIFASPIYFLIRACFYFVIGWLLINLLSKMLKRFIKKGHENAVLYSFLLSVIRIAARVVLLITCMDYCGIPVTSLLTAIGALGLALSLAMQDSLSNLAHGVMLLFARPFKQGDYVEIDSLGGFVAYIDLMHVVLQTPDHKRVFISNSQAVKAKIVNYSTMEKRRLEQTYVLKNVEDISMILEIMRKIIDQHPLALNNPEPLVKLSAVQTLGLSFICRVWVLNDDYWDLHWDLLEQITKALKSEGVAF